MTYPAMIRAAASVSLRPTMLAPLTSLNNYCMGVLPLQQQLQGDQNQQQVRFITKTKRKRLEKHAKRAKLAERGIFPSKPPNYIDPKTNTVINAITREERDRVAKEAEGRSSEEMKERMEIVQEKDPLLRFHFEGLTMNDRVRKLFDLTNGSQSEVVKAQKERGMDLFQTRESDTGSSAVQVIALTTRIQQMQTHIRTHRKDHSGKRGLDALYVRRRKVLDYMERKDFEGYRKVVKTLGLVR